MKHTTVDGSKVIQSYGYENGLLEVRIGGRLYSGDVTREEFEAFEQAESKGTHFGKHFRTRMVRVEERADAPV